PLFPARLAGAHVERARIARRALRHLVHVRADHGDVAEDRRRAAVRHADVDAAVFAEAGHRRAGSRVDGVEPRAAREEDARPRALVAFPVADAARRYSARAALALGARDDISPDLVAGARIERDDPVAARHVHHAA